MKQESAFFWSYTDAPLADGSRWQLKLAEQMSDADFEMAHEDDNIDAFTVAELGEMLPHVLELHGHQYLWHSMKGSTWYCRYETFPERKQLIAQDWRLMGDHDTEANARAQMLVYLLENKLIEV